MRGQSKTKEQLKNELNKPRHRIIEQDRSEDKRKQIEEALRESEEKYRTILENIEDGYYEVDIAGNFTFFNDSICRIWGYPKEELMGMNNRQYTDQENAKKLFQAFHEVYRTGEPAKGFDWQIIRKDGTKRYIEASVSLQKDSPGKPTGFRGIIRDITERKKIEEALRWSEETARALLNATTDSVFLIDSAGTVLTLNEITAKRLNTRVDEMLGAPLYDFLPPDVAKRRKTRFDEVFRTGKPAYFEDERQGIWFDNCVYPIFDVNGKVMKLAIYGRDITEQKRAEAVLQESEERFRQVAENADVWIWEVDANGLYTYVSPVVGKILGYEPEEIVGTKHFYDFFSPDVKDDLRKAAFEVFARRESFKCFVNPNLHKNGDLVYLETNGTPIVDDEGNLLGYRGADIDITERKRAEEVLRESEEKYRTILENIEDGYYEVDIAGNFTFLNDSICRIWGYPRGELMGMNDRQYTDQENGKKLFQTFNRVYRTGEPAKGFNWEIIRKDGAKRYIEASVSLRRDSSGKPIGFRGIIRDITERKQAEGVLKQSEEKFKQLFDDAPMGYFEYDSQGRITSVNRTELEMLGYTFEEMIGQPVWRFIVEEEKARQQILAKLAGAIPPFRDFERIYRRKNGTTFPVLIEDRLLKDEKGRITGMRCILQDITERRRAQEALRESEEKYRTILENIEDSYYEVDIAGNFTFFNDSLCRMLGYSRDELLGMNNRQYMDQEGANRLYRTFNRVYRTGEPAKAFDHEIIRKDGTKGFAEASVTLMKDSAGQACGFRGITRDITERKRTEEVLKESEERYRTVIEHSNDGVSIVKGGTHLYANRKFLEMFGYDHPEEVIGKPILITVHPDDRDRVVENTLRRQRGEDAPSKYEFKGIRKDGSIIYIEVSATKTTYCGETVSLVNLRDMTDRKRMEQEKAVLEEQLRQSQKIEAIGRLAGGIAHDFNNLLTVITGYSDSILSQLQPHDLIRGETLEIKIAAEKAASLTRQLLAFSRKQILQPKVLDLNDLIGNIDKMLRRLIGEDIYLSTHLSKDLGKVKADPGQMEQVIMNLVVNARDAMPSGGKLMIETANVELDEYYAQAHMSVAPGHYSMISMTDTGIGMSSEVRERIFEPFFTTKEEGKGTGLGLSTVYGIVKQSGGNIWVYSEPGKGTTFKIYLPRTEEDIKLVQPKVITTKPVQGSETILLVEDEETVRRFARLLLQRNGYRLLEASNGKEALRIVQEQRDQPIHLLMTDMG